MTEDHSVTSSLVLTGLLSPGEKGRSGLLGPTGRQGLPGTRGPSGVPGALGDPGPQVG